MRMVLQLNFCKTLACDNFGLSDAKRYVLQHANPKRPAMVCRECGAFPLANNREVLSELHRLNRFTAMAFLLAAMMIAITLAYRFIPTNIYHAFGYSGDRQRYRCKDCQSTFVDKWSGSIKNFSFKREPHGLIVHGLFRTWNLQKIRDQPKDFLWSCWPYRQSMPSQISDDRCSMG